MTPRLICPSCNAETPVESDSTVCTGCGSRYGTTGLYRGKASAEPASEAVTERDVQESIKLVLEMLGFMVSDLSQPRASMQTPGLPDLFATHPDWQLSLWCEVKRPGGKASAAQREWHRTAKEAGNLVLVAESAADVVSYLREHGAPLEDVA